jgi:hypothetical protein
MVKKGDIVRTKDGREHTVKKVDGRFIYFTDGAMYGLNHPDIETIETPKKKKENKSETEDA